MTTTAAMRVTIDRRIAFNRDCHSPVMLRSAGGRMVWLNCSSCKEESAMLEADTTILLVEPDPDLQPAIRELLEFFGYRVLATSNTEQAVHSYSQHAARIDGLVVAAYMPGTTGIGLVDMLREFGRPLPALLLSVLGADLSLQQRVSSGDIGFLSVPFVPDRFKHKLREVFERAPVERNDGEQLLVLAHQGP